MARTPTTHDPFNAIAEPKRRQLLEALGTAERSVNDLVQHLGWPQPMVSKHLSVLKQVGLVSERRAGRQRLYRINAAQLKPIHDWIQPFQRLWLDRLDRLEQYLIELHSQDNPPPEGSVQNDAPTISLREVITQENQDERSE